MITTDLPVIYLMQKEKGLVDKSTLTGFMSNSDLNKKTVTLAAKAELKSKEKKIIKLKALFL